LILRWGFLSFRLLFLLFLFDQDFPVLIGRWFLLLLLLGSWDFPVLIGLWFLLFLLWFFINGISPFTSM
jgi:hypothetical protein